MTTWLNETGAHCLLAVMVLMAFWGAVFAALTSLLGNEQHTPPAQRPSAKYWSRG